MDELLTSGGVYSQQGWIRRVGNRVYNVAWSVVIRYPTMSRLLASVSRFGMQFAYHGVSADSHEISSADIGKNWGRGLAPPPKKKKKIL